MNNAHYDEEPRPFLQGDQGGRQLITVDVKSNFDDLENPGHFFCPKCEQVAISQIEHTRGTWTYSLTALLCCCTIVGGLIPLFWSRCQDRTFVCKQCKTYAGRTEFKPQCC